MGRKRQTQAEAFSSYPEPTEGQYIGKVVDIRGGGLYDVHVPESPAALQPNEQTLQETPLPTFHILLSSLPSRFKNVVWVKKGSFVIVEPKDSKTKIQAEMLHVLLADQVKHLKQIGKWPPAFLEAKPIQSDSEDDLFVNNNRMTCESSTSSDEEL